MDPGNYEDTAEAEENDDDAEDEGNAEDEDRDNYDQQDSDGNDDQPRPPRRRMLEFPAYLEREDSEPLFRFSRGKKHSRDSNLVKSAAGFQFEGNNRSEFHNPDDKLEEEPEPAPKLRKVDTTSKGRGCLKYFDDEGQDLISTAQSIYEVSLIMRSPFPTQHEQDDWAKEAFEEACLREGVAYAITPEVLKMVRR